MKLALLSDLHANRQATEAVFAHAQKQGFDRLVFLGDYVDYGGDPAWTLEFVREQVKLGAVAVRGNHDDALDEEHTTTQMAGHVLPSLAWTRSQLTLGQQAWLMSLPLTAEVGPCLVAHANVHDPANWGYLQGRMEATRSLFASRHQFVFCGHMHQPTLYNLSATGKSGEFMPIGGVPIPLSPARRWLGIPGSVGQPRDGNPAACYAIFDTDKTELTFFRVPYDHEKAAGRVLEAGLPQSLAERLIQGR